MFGINELYGSGAANRSRCPPQTETDQRETTNFCDECWRLWPRADDWPAYLDAFEAAAYLRVSYWTILRLSRQGRDGLAKLGHQRIGTAYRFRRSTLDNYGQVPGRF
ncbi:MAG: helix-turn-helix domain-containing protein [Opitutaceae bacterium]|jgi:excisionase family DNA binding protein